MHQSRNSRLLWSRGIPLCIQDWISHSKFLARLDLKTISNQDNVCSDSFQWQKATKFYAYRVFHSVETSKNTPAQKPSHKHLKELFSEWSERRARSKSLRSLTYTNNDVASLYLELNIKYFEILFDWDAIMSFFQVSRQVAELHCFQLWSLKSMQSSDLIWSEWEIGSLEFFERKKSVQFFLLTFWDLCQSPTFQVWLKSNVSKTLESLFRDSNLVGQISFILLLRRLFRDSQHSIWRLQTSIVLLLTEKV